MVVGESSVTKALVAEQCRVVLVDRNRESMEQVVKEATGALLKRDHNYNDDDDDDRNRTLILECDVTKMDQVRSVIQQADQFASNHETKSDGSTMMTMATLLVNCAGITRDNWVSKMSLEDWDLVVDVNLTGTFRTCRAFLDQERMKRFQELQSRLLLPLPTTEAEAGGHAVTTSIAAPTTSSSNTFSIVNVGSIVSEYGNLGQANYAASKGGVLGLTRALAKETAHRNVRVNAVVPGFIDTPMAQAVPDTVKETIILPKIPMGRFGRPDEIADVVTFLLSPRSSYITGESVRVSGMISL